MFEEILPKIEQREYQINIAKTCLEKGNTLAILPTGTGKTIIALLVASERLKKGDVLMLAPTKPLVIQHTEFFKKFFDNIYAFTGEKPWKKRKEIWESPEQKMIVATPQTVENDLEKGISLTPFSLIIFDEAHRAVGEYAYVNIAKEYMKQARNPLILGITASPGYSKEKIEEICKNLFIKHIEIRTGTEHDIKKYMQPVEIKVVKVPIPPLFKEIRDLLKEYVKKNKPEKVSRLTRKYLLEIQKWALENQAYDVLINASSLLSVMHAMHLLDSQGISATHAFFERLWKKKTKSAAHLRRDSLIIKARERIKSLLGKLEHPKLETLKSLVLERIQENKTLIIFSHYRDTGNLIKKELENLPGVKPVRFYGQAKRGSEKGLSQKEQKEIIDQFKKGEFNVLICTSVGEEGIDIPRVDTVIFYEPIPSEIRTIQRRGRAGRISAGEVIILVAKGSSDEGNFWTSVRKEKTMKETIKRIKKPEYQTKINNWW